MGHSVGEYGALVAAGSMSFDDAIEAVSARGREMAHINVADPGMMAAAIAPLAEVEEIVAEHRRLRRSGEHQLAASGRRRRCERRGPAGGRRATAARPHRDPAARQPRLPHRDRRVGQRAAGLDAPAAWTARTDAAGRGQRRTASSIRPTATSPAQMVEMLSRQVASPVQFVKGLRTLFDAGARVFVEVGPKHALQGFASDVLGDDTVMSLATNHPKAGDVASFNAALGAGCGLRPGRRPRAGCRCGRRAESRSDRAVAADRCCASSRGGRTDGARRSQCRPSPQRRPRRPRTVARRWASRSSSPAQRSVYPAPIGCLTTATSPACSQESRASTCSLDGCAARCSTSTSPASSRAMTGAPRLR